MSTPASMLRPWTRHRRATPEQLAALGVGAPILAQLLYNRGVRSPDAAAAILAPARPAAPDPSEMAGLPAAIHRIEHAVNAGEKIVVYGDYDVDGLSGSTVLQRALRAIGATVEVFIPHRDRDGYGLNTAVLAALAEQAASLVVTVDCGVSAAAEVAAANAIGLDVIVTDHHDVPLNLPAAVAIVNPHQPDCPSPFKQLAGAGVALKLALALAERRLSPAARVALEPALLQLAALGTVSDVMPLMGENVGIVRHGLRALNDRPTPGLAALVRRSGLTRPWVTAEDIAFRLAPRLNAAGRISEASITQRLLATSDPVEADELADELEVLNTRRRELGAAALEAARVFVGAYGTDPPPALVVESLHPAGVLGLVAVRLVEETGRLVAVLEQTDGVSRASVRAPATHSAIDAVNACSDFLLRYGGHRGAAGFSIEGSRIPAFRAAFEAAVASQEALPPAEAGLVADARLRPETVSEALLDLLEQLGPFGHGAPEPLFETGPLVVREARTVGEKHLRLKLQGDGRLLDGIAFNGATEAPPPGSQIVILYKPKANVWQGRRRAEVEVVAWRPAAG
jgi:single-stranded-DNA-specific exonuclease